MTACDERRIRNWVHALTTSIHAITGQRWEQSAADAETPGEGTWDRVRGDGTLHLPWVEVHETPCPGPPWATEPDRWNGSLYCGRKHFHSRESLGVAPAGAP